MNAVVRAAVNLCTGLYISVGFLGYVALAGEQFAGNILLSLSKSTSSDVFQLGFVLSIALSFPIVVFPCRASLNSLLFKKASFLFLLPFHRLTCLDRVRAELVLTRSAVADHPLITASSRILSLL